MLNNDEREPLMTVAVRRKSAQALAQRTRIVLRCAECLTNTAVAEEERITMQTVGKWLRRFVQLRLVGLDDAARSGARRRRLRLPLAPSRRECLRRPKSSRRIADHTVASFSAFVPLACVCLWLM